MINIHTLSGSCAGPSNTTPWAYIRPIDDVSHSSWTVVLPIGLPEPEHERKVEVSESPLYHLGKVILQGSSESERMHTIWFLVKASLITIGVAPAVGG